jgi:ribosomal protein L11 methyltransferase
MSTEIENLKTSDWVYLLPSEPGLQDEIESFLYEAGSFNFFIDLLPNGVFHLHWVGLPEAHEPPFLHLVEKWKLTFLEKVERDAIDWIRTWRENTPPIELLPGLWINPHETLSETIPKNAHVLHIVPSFAFGTGHHFTTRSATTLLSKYLKKGDAALDLGCGTGVLSLVAWHLGASAVLSSDYDPFAVAKARETLDEHGYSQTEIILSNLLASIPTSRRYELVLANIQTEILVELFKDPKLEQLIKPETVFILSGIGHNTRPELENVLAVNHFQIIDELRDDTWNSLVVKRL